jgi:flavin reductase (DIM6/NTAB) family NADH-FMN oxidoreductase RutF
MAKIEFKPGTMIYPLPAVMVSCGETPEEYNIITIAWTGTICSDPPMCYISVRPGRHSYDILKRTGEFVINLTTEELARATDWCGCRSGRKYNKWEEMNLTPVPAKMINAPVIAESPVNIECVVKQIIPLGTHDMFIAAVVHISAEESFMDEKGAFSLSRARPLVYNHGYYFGLGKKIGKFGWSVERKVKGNR